MEYDKWPADETKPNSSPPVSGIRRRVVAVLQNEPIWVRRGYVGLRRRVAPRGRSADCVCQNKPIFRVAEASLLRIILYTACRHSALFPFTLYLLTFLQNKAIFIPLCFSVPLCGKKQNKPIWARRGYVGSRHRATPRGRSADYVCQNEPICQSGQPLVSLYLPKHGHAASLNKDLQHYPCRRMMGGKLSRIAYNYLQDKEKME